MAVDDLLMSGVDVGIRTVAIYVQYLYLGERIESQLHSYLRSSRMETTHSLD